MNNQSLFWVCMWGSDPRSGVRIGVKSCINTSWNFLGERMIARPDPNPLVI